MHHDFIDRYSRLDSPIHRLRSTPKVVVGLITIAITVLCPVMYFYPFLIILGIQLFVIASSKIPIGLFCKKNTFV